MYPGAHAQTMPDKVAYVMGASGETVTYAQLDERSNRLAQLLHHRGLRHGDVLAVFMENNARFLEVAWAAQRSGLYYTCISSRLTPGETEYILNDSGAKALVTSHACARVAAQVVEATPGVTTRLMCNGAVEGFEAYEDAVAGYPAEPVPDEREGTDLLYSSGTTGRPKGVKPPLPLAPVGTPSGVALLGGMLYGYGPDMVYLSPAPLYHAAPLRFTMAVQRHGGSTVVMEHFEPIEFLRLVEEHHVTHAQVVPTMFVRLLKLPAEERGRFDVSSLRTVIHAAAPCPVPVKEQMIEWWGPVIYEYYAGTEGNGFVACTSEEWLAHRGSVGRPLVGVVHICDESGAEVPAGEPGIVYFAGGPEFEYHNDPEKTRRSQHPEHAGWTTLGDVGYLDGDGYLYLTDRLANMIISGGVNVYPQETENVLTMHPKVMDVAVFGVPNDELGEEVKAVVQPVDMSAAGPELEAELIEFARQRLAPFKVPRSVDFEAEIPRHPTGKLYKRLLKDRYWAGHQTRII
ncbi:MAG TPA: AMP-binding protein [Acidimicrobiales bacterium]|nr:AMP-binding protein [Acidimicrobiales bacterium]